MLSLFRQARAAGALLLAASALWLVGCVTVAPATPEEVVAQRCKERWDAMIASDFEKAWTYTQPGFRAAVQQRNYEKRFGGAGQWTAMEVYKTTCEADRCTVSIKLTSKLLLPGFKGRELSGAVDEVWVREDGQWWRYEAL